MGTHSLLMRMTRSNRPGLSLFAKACVLSAVFALAALAVPSRSLAQSSPQFKDFGGVPYTSVPGFGSVRGMAVGDINGDGIPDVVGARWQENPGTVVVALGDGHGGFSSFNTYTTLGAWPQMVALADFNGDGKLDVAVANGDNTVAVAFGDGHGGLGAPTIYSLAFTGGTVTSVAPGVFNNGGKPDLAVSVSGPVGFGGGFGWVYVLTNDGSGGFTVPSTGMTTTFVGYGSGPAIHVATADLDGDGNVDIVATNSINQFQTFPTVSIFYGEGDGGFSAPQQLTIGPEAQATAIADVDGDGRPDLIVSLYRDYVLGGGSVAVFRNTGSGTFAAPVRYQTCTGTQLASVGDLNNDGKPDLVAVCNADQVVAYLLNDGHSGFGSANFIPWLFADFNSVVADLDGNGPGWLDIVISSQYFGVRLVLNGPAAPADTTPPVITVPSNITTEATGPSGTLVSFSVSATDNVDGSVAVICAPASGSTFPLGITVVNCSASDAAGNNATASFMVTVQDTTPPRINSVTPSRTSLWPPNKAMIPISVAVNASDAATASPTCRIDSVSSNEPGSGEWQVTGALTVTLKADRLGTGSGRVYSISVTCTDGAGNASRASTTVTVPHDQGK